MRLILNFNELKDWRACKMYWLWKNHRGLSLKEKNIPSPEKKIRELLRDGLELFDQGKEVSWIERELKSYYQYFIAPHLIISQQIYWFKQLEKEMIVIRSYSEIPKELIQPPKVIWARIPSGKKSSHTFFSFPMRGIVSQDGYWLLQPTWSGEPTYNVLLWATSQNFISLPLKGFYLVSMDKLLSGKDPVQMLDFTKEEIEGEGTELFKDTLAIREVRYGKKIQPLFADCEKKHCPYWILCSTYQHKNKKKRLAEQEAIIDIFFDQEPTKEETDVENGE